MNHRSITFFVFACFKSIRAKISSGKERTVMGTPHLNEKGLVRLIPVPTPFPVGDVNLYLILRDPLTLIDSGPKTIEAYKALNFGLKSAGLEVKDIKRIVITHPHIDHVGLAGVLKRDAPHIAIALHQEIQPFLSTFQTLNEIEKERAESLFALSGMDKELQNQLLPSRMPIGAYGADLKADIPLNEGDTLLFEGFDLSVIPTPGHTPWCLSFFLEKEGLLFSGDFILEKITPNPLFYGKDRRPLLAYRNSLKKVSRLKVGGILGGHGGMIDNPSLRVQRLLTLTQRRSQRIRRVLSNTPKTLFEISKELFQEVALKQPFLVLSEVYAHLQDLVERQEAFEVSRNGTLKFIASNSSHETQKGGTSGF